MRGSKLMKLRKFAPWLAILFSVSLLALHFFIGGGRTRIITDSYNYLSVSDGVPPGTPFNTRIAGPYIAWFIASISGISNQAAFQVLTFFAVLASLFLLRVLIRDLGGSAEWQGATLLSIGCALAATFGYIPVMADPLLLLFTCVVLLALQRGHFEIAIVSAILAGLTKEYGLLLSPVVAIVSYRRGHRKAAYAAALLPAISFFAITFLPAGTSGHGFQSWRSFVSAMFGYQLSMFQYRGAIQYPQYLYMWAWSAFWPGLVIAFAVIFSRLRRGVRMQDHEVAFLIMSLAVPILLLGDWGRSMLIVVPFACIVATSHRLASRNSFALLLAVGGLSTALARPFHSDRPLPLAFTLTMTAVSVVSSSLIGLKMLKWAPDGSTEVLRHGVDNPASEAVAPGLSQPQESV